jgi:hypothetical protein
MTLEHEVSVGRQARSVLNDPIIIDAFGKIESGLMEKWKNSPIGDVDGREKIFHMISAVELLRVTLKCFIDDGLVAEAQIKANEALEKRKLGDIHWADR